MTRKNAMRGFTLMEIIIAVAIVGAVAAIAYPSYQDSVRKSRRADARAVLTEAAQFMERGYTANLTTGYTNVTLPTALLSSPKGGGTSSSYYTIALSGVAQNTYTLTATPTSTGGQYKDKCGALTLNNAGVKGQGGATVEECWR